MKRGYAHKRTVRSLVEGGGKVRSFHVDHATVASVTPILRKNVRRNSELMTDENGLYMKVEAEFAAHDSVVTLPTSTSAGMLTRTP